MGTVLPERNVPFCMILLMKSPSVNTLLRGARCNNGSFNPQSNKSSNNWEPHLNPDFKRRIQSPNDSLSQSKQFLGFNSSQRNSLFNPELSTETSRTPSFDFSFLPGRRLSNDYIKNEISWRPRDNINSNLSEKSSSTEGDDFSSSDMPEYSSVPYLKFDPASQRSERLSYLGNQISPFDSMSRQPISPQKDDAAALSQNQISHSYIGEYNPFNFSFKNKTSRLPQIDSEYGSTCLPLYLFNPASQLLDLSRYNDFNSHTLNKNPATHKFSQNSFQYKNFKNLEITPQSQELYHGSYTQNIYGHRGLHL
ncbi:hypothetical protein AYI68_g5273 [Smittium mucronatum]|uniref:Uncharacterized protein n=1 Tax=Smittium mucronatum TaxID=133383 RepID=A0A1R0GUV0_9FUNG|nr:hypothetical protein AYI68_g5273 [Smittium mucronatum]